MAYLAIDGEDWSDRVRFLMHDELQQKISMATLGSPDAVADGLKDEWLRVAWEDEEAERELQAMQREFEAVWGEGDDPEWRWPAIYDGTRILLNGAPEPVD